jgi:hypothetical protein
VQRGKGSVRNTPATPGMGLLLRFGTNAGQEISFLADPILPRCSDFISGRAPPRAGPSPNPAPAALPSDHPLATSSRDPRLALRASDARSGPTEPKLPMANVLRSLVPARDPIEGPDGAPIPALRRS